MNTCPFCKEPLPDAATTCPACAEPLKVKKDGSATPRSVLTQSNGRAVSSSEGARSRVWNLLLWAFGSALTLAVLVVAITTLKEERFWPFATGTSNPAFLGTTFGMSPQEAKRALDKEGAVLATYQEYRRLDGTHETNLFDYLYTSKEEERMHSDLFMPSIELFGSATEARFVFRKEQLESVEIFFKCYTASNALTLIESVKSNLLGVYQLSEKEDSQYVPGAFNLKYRTTESAANMWVNLTDPKELMVNLFL